MKPPRRCRRPYALRIGVSLVFGFSIGCVGAPAPGPEVVTEVPLDTTGVVVNLDSVRAQLTRFASRPARFSRRATCPGCTADVEVRRTSRTNDIKADDGPTTPRQIAVITNLDPRDTTEMYHFEPGKQYAFQIGRDRGTGAATYSMIEVPPGHTGRLRVVAGGRITKCTPTHAPGWSKVSFGYCSDYAASDSWLGSSMIDFASVRDLLVSAIRLVLPDRLALERAGWFSCDSGCCTA